jgi:hypothetical protein
MIKIRQKVLVSLLCGITILPLLLVACTADTNTTNPPQSQTNTPPSQPNTPLLSTSGIVEKLSLNDIAARANSVVLGKVKNIDYQKEANGNINTLVTFSVDHLTV